MKTYYNYLEQINSLNVLEKLTYELVMFQKNKNFNNIYIESKIDEIELEETDRVLRIAKKFSIKTNEVSFLKKAFVYFKPELKETIDTYLFDLKIATSFGLGIGSLIPSIINFMSKMQISISKENAILLAVGVIMGVIYSKQKEIIFLKKTIKKLFSVIKSTKLKKTLSIIIIISKKLWIPIDKTLEFMAYTILAIPFANFLSSFLKDVKFNPELAKQALMGMAIGGLIHIFRKVAPKLWNNFSKFFKRKK